MEDVGVYLNAASSRESPSELLLELTQHHQRLVRLTAAANPRLTAELAEQASLSGDDAVLQGIAGRADISDVMVMQVLTRGGRLVQHVLASNPHVSPTTLLALSRGDDAVVAAAARRNPTLTQWARSHTKKDTSPPQ